MLKTESAINTMHQGTHTHTKTSGCVCARLPTQKCNKYPLRLILLLSENIYENCM